MENEGAHLIATAIEQLRSAAFALPASVPRTRLPGAEDLYNLDDTPGQTNWITMRYGLVRRWQEPNLVSAQDITAGEVGIGVVLRLLDFITPEELVKGTPDEFEEVVCWIRGFIEAVRGRMDQEIAKSTLKTSSFGSWSSRFAAGEAVMARWPTAFGEWPSVIVAPTDFNVALATGVREPDSYLVQSIFAGGGWHWFATDEVRPLRPTELEDTKGILSNGSVRGVPPGWKKHGSTLKVAIEISSDPVRLARHLKGSNQVEKALIRLRTTPAYEPY